MDGRRQERGAERPIPEKAVAWWGVVPSATPKGAEAGGRRRVVVEATSVWRRMGEEALAEAKGDEPVSELHTPGLSGLGASLQASASRSVIVASDDA